MYTIRKTLLFLFVLSLTLSSVHAQKANYELARKMLVPTVFTTNITPVFLKDSDKFWFSVRTPKGTDYYFADPKNKERRKLFDNESFVRGINELTGITIHPGQVEIPHFEFSDDERSFDLFLDRFRLSYDFYKNEFTACDTLNASQMQQMQQMQPPVNPRLSPDGRYEIFARNHNLFVRETATGTERQLTTDGERYHSYATADDAPPSDNEVVSRALWLGDSKRIAINVPDYRKVEDFYIMNSLTPRPFARKYKYMVPGDLNVVQFAASIINVETGERVALEADKWKDQTMDIVYLSPKSDYVYLLRKNRLVNQMELCKADAATGKVEAIISETMEPYFNDQLFQFSFLNGGKDIIWFSERTGWGHLYHYNDNGKLLNAITEGEWNAGQILRVDTSRREIYFEGYGYDKAQNPYYQQTFRANIDKKGVRLLTPEDANHRTIVTPKGHYIVDNYSRVDLDPVTVLRDRNGKMIAELARADLSAWKADGWQYPERFVVKAADGTTDLHGVMWKPADFDPSRKYPIITHVYPGPQTENIPLDFTPTGGYDGPLAQLGFVVVMFGNRGGSPLRGAEYHTFGHGNLRDYAIEDNKHGLEQLAARHPFIDLDRVGIFGNSGGGMMTFAAMCLHPQFYKVGVSASGNHDNRIFNRWWGETHHGVEQFYGDFRTPDGQMMRDTAFRSVVPNNIELAPRLQGHLMLVTGDMDDNVHPAQTYRLVDALIKAGKNFEFVLLPGNGHDFVRQAMVYYRFKTWFHFSRYLLGDDSADQLVNLSQLGRPAN